MEIAGWAGIFASLLGLVLTIYGVFYNGRANRALMRSIQADIQTTQALIEALQAQTARYQENAQALLAAIQADIQTARHLTEAVQAQTARQHEDTRALIEAFQAQMARQHEDTRALIEAIRVQSARQHEDLMAFLREMDRRHTEIMARLAELIVAAGE